MKIPSHIGIIPDGNRRWAEKNNLSREKGYFYGLKPGLELFKLSKKLGIKELTYYGFTMDNTKRPTRQRQAFSKACIEAVKMLADEDANLLVVGNINTPMFPQELLEFTKERKRFGPGDIKVNFLVNYGWHWDLSQLSYKDRLSINDISANLKSRDISRLDLIIRWGGRRRLSGFLPVQSIYADFYVVKEYWPDYRPQHLHEALKWYSKQDITLGG